VNQLATLPQVRGRLTPNAPLAPLVWFKSGGNAEWLFEPKDEEDLVEFLRDLIRTCRSWRSASVQT
jgi:UDP-N-acetylmuramate dehydrogenase